MLQDPLLSLSLCSAADLGTAACATAHVQPQHRYSRGIRWVAACPSSTEVSHKQAYLKND